MTKEGVKRLKIKFRNAMATLSKYRERTLDSMTQDDTDEFMRAAIIAIDALQDIEMNQRIEGSTSAFFAPVES